GFSTLRHRLYYHIELAQPLLMAAMVLFAAAFCVRLSERVSMLRLIVAGTVTGFLLFVATDIVRALGYSSSLPVALAAWSPTMVSVFLSTAMLLHLEDG
ncbi:MAG: LptF/LptG family permease, partial [Pseudomonadota bacterium]